MPSLCLNELILCVCTSHYSSLSWINIPASNLFNPAIYCIISINATVATEFGIFLICPFYPIIKANVVICGFSGDKLQMWGVYGYGHNLKLPHLSVLVSPFACARSGDTPMHIIPHYIHTKIDRWFNSLWHSDFIRRLTSGSKLGG